MLLKYLGCRSNAARICELYLSDDLPFKRDFKTVGDSLTQMLRFVFTHTGMTVGFSELLRGIVNIVRNGRVIAQELIQTRCRRGADIAPQLRFPDAVADGIHNLYEHWNGRVTPQALSGEAIPLYARIALLAQGVDALPTADGPAAALKEARHRAGQWFDPELARTFEQAAPVPARVPAVWATLGADGIDGAVQALEPGAHEVRLDDDDLDDLAAAFGQVVDSKFR